jgi:two-component system OmpR family response regulator/two-component system alkaline phosphatase synthesis response regulator PhoP
MTAPAFPQRRILVVDDEPFVCEAVKMMLNFDGHIVETAGDPREALAMFEPGKYDLVMTDYSMPSMKGDALARAIKARDAKQPVVMITAYAEVLPKNLEGVDDVVPKPFLLENLRAAMARVLSPSPAS